MTDFYENYLTEDPRLYRHGFTVSYYVLTDYTDRAMIVIEHENVPGGWMRRAAEKEENRLGLILAEFAAGDHGKFQRIDEDDIEALMAYSDGRAAAFIP